MKRFTTAVVAALMLGTALLGRPAGADPIANKKAEAARLAAQLEAKGNQAEILTEQYNAARLKAGGAETDARRAEQQLAVADAAVGRAQVALKASAVEAYVHGGFLPGGGGDLTTPEGALELSVRRKYMNVVADRQADALRSLRVARTDAAARREELDAAKQASRQALAAVESKRVAAAAAVKEQKALLDKANGELATLVAAEQKRKADEEARRVQAAIAARRTGGGGSGAPVVLNRNTGTAPVNPPPPPNAGAAKAIEEAKRQLGKPYEWAGSGPDTFDCSGLTAWAWKAGGKTLSHYTGAQWNETARVDVSALQPGDLVFFGSDLHHVGLFVGNGQMIEAPSTGQVVRYASIYRSDLVQQGGRVY
ncbi:MAG TPA: NlpC/P60 family protein [Acidimicrobiales bacterium]|nr:NlpC/P60 family protein [Acidimicrobiales bacterium]